MSDLLRYFDELCDLTPALREPRLAELAAEDAELTKQLRAMLDADSNTTELVSHDIEKQPQLGADLFRKPTPQADFGAYKMLRELGTGGMGTVWLAERSVGSSVQQVAIKFMRHSSPQLLKHFEREREALARLEHPNIARLIDAGEGPDGAPYIACEFVDGQLLLDYIRAQKLDLQGRLKLIEVLCEAVDYAHRRLVVHRDIKPSNVMVDHSGRVRLLDFGIAKALDAEPAEHTQNNPLSPAYAAPEQAMGQPISTATDVFGLGLLLFEVLTGQLPAQRKSVSASDMAHKIDVETIEAPSLSNANEISELDPTIAGREWRTKLRGDLDLIVLKALKREPERRYVSALALADDLRRFRERKTIAARPDSNRYRMQKFIARNRLMVGSASATFLALIAGFSIALWQANVAREQAKIAQAQTLRALRVKDFLISLFAETEGVGRSGTERSPLDLVKAGIENAGTELVNDNELQNSVIGDLLDIQINLGDWQAAASNVEQVLNYRRRNFEVNDVRIAEVLASKINLYFRGGKFSDAEPLIENALAIFRHNEQAIDVADMQNRLVRVRISQGRFQEALELMHLVVKQYEAHWGKTHPRFGLSLSNLSTVQMRLRQYDAAQASLDQSISILELANGKSHASLLFPLTTLGDLHRSQGNFEQALKNYQRTSEITQSTLGETHPSFAVSISRIGDVYRRLGELDLSKSNLVKALDIQQTRQDMGLGDTFARLGDLSVAASQPEAAIDWFQKAHQFQLKTQGEKSAITWDRLASAAAVMIELERFDEARAILQTVSARTAALGKDSTRDLILTKAQIAMLERSAKNYGLAVKLLTECKTELALLTTPEDPKLHVIAINLALTHALIGAPENRAIASELLTGL